MIRHPASFITGTLSVYVQFSWAKIHGHEDNGIVCKSLTLTISKTKDETINSFHFWLMTPNLQPPHVFHNLV